MIFSFFSLFLFFVLTSSNETEHLTPNEAQLTTQQSEFSVDQDEQPEIDCRYLDEPIPHRDLSGYEIVSEQPSELNEELKVEQSIKERETDSVQGNKVEEKLELSPTEIEARE